MKRRRQLSPWLATLVGLSLLLAVPAARAGLAMQMDLFVFNYNNYAGYSFNPVLNTNNTLPNVSFGDYAVASPGWPTAGAYAQYHFDTNGFNLVNNPGTSFGSFDAPDYDNSFIQNLTNGLWSLFVTNGMVTNVYYFTVSASLDSNAISLVAITFPTNGEVGVPNNPAFTWQGPANFSDLVMYGPNFSGALPPEQTSFSGSAVGDGLYNLTVHYDLFTTNDLVVCSVPLDGALNAVSGWVSTLQVQDYANVQFTVGTVDTSGTGYALVADYTWDTTNADGSASGVDSSGDGYNLDYRGTFGSAGDVNWTTNAAVGPGAIQFHDGDGNSGGYAGWNSTPTTLLADIAGSFTISCWINTTQYFDYPGDYAYNGAGIVSAYTGDLANDVIPIALTGGQVAFNTGGEVEDDTLNSHRTVNDGYYHQVVVTRNQTTGQKIIYVDGVLDSYGYGTTNLLTDAPLLTIGALADATDPNANDANYYNGYDGLLDDLQIYSGVLSSNQVAYLYANRGATLENTSQVFNHVFDTTNLPWATGGDASWFSESSYTYNGAPSAAQSGGVTGSQSTTLSTTFTGPRTLTFYWASIANDPNGGFNYEFDLDGGFMANDNGDIDWREAGPFIIPPGPHTLSWTVSANGDTDPTEAGFLDQLTFSAPAITVSNYPSAGLAPLIVYFTSPGTDSVTNTVVNRLWNFGDGFTSNAQNPAHTYTTPGQYQPTLVAYSANDSKPLVVSGLGTINVGTDLPGALASFQFDNFSDTKSLQLNGSATNVTTSDGAVLELTPANYNQAGSAFIANPVAFGPNLGFSTFFMFRMHNSGGTPPPADGITFTIQSDTATQVGGSGGQLGYAGIPKSFCVSFDTFDNGTEYGNPGAPSGNYVALNWGGALNDSIFANVTNSPMSDGNVWYVWIDYEGVSQDLEVRLSETPVRPLTPIVDAQVNLPAFIGSTNAFVGFTGGTGSGWQQHDILAWKFQALPTTRITGSFSLVNTPPGFRFNYGLVMFRSIYSVAGNTFTNYSFAPINTVSNANAQLAFSTGIAELVGNSKSALAGLNPNAIDVAVSNNAVAIDEGTVNDLAVLGTYENADNNVEGAVLATYDNNTGFNDSTAYYANNSFENTFNMTETNYESLVDQVNLKAIPGLFPPSLLAQLQIDATNFTGPNNGTWLSSGPGGVIQGNLITYTYGTAAGTMEASQQVVYSPPMPLFVLTPRTDGTHFIFDFGTVSNQSYTVWFNSNLATTNWASWTNFISDGYVQEITVPLANGVQSFFRLSSP